MLSPILLYAELSFLHASQRRTCVEAPCYLHFSCEMGRVGSACKSIAQSINQAKDFLSGLSSGATARSTGDSVK